MNISKPQDFLSVRVHDFLKTPGLTGLCAGYEQTRWRSSQLADHVMEWLPEFVLTYAERKTFDISSGVHLLRKAARLVYETGKFQDRGEFGELLLHIAIRQVFNSEPAISKLYFKTASNDTVKGFDAVHVVSTQKGLELWLGEAKFYKDITRAITAVVKELESHTKANYLRSEFTVISNHLDAAWPHAAELKKLLSPNTTLDEVFVRACIPVLLTYDSEVVRLHTKVDQKFERALISEIEKHYELFKSKALPSSIRVHLFLLPLKTKLELVQALDRKLRYFQNI